MKKWMISLIILTFSLAAVGVVAGFTLTGGGGDAPEGTSPTDEVTGDLPTYEEWLDDYGSEPGVPLHRDPTYEQCLDDFGPVQGPFASIDDIDPNECNLVHNIHACSPEELEALGWADRVDDAPVSSAVCAIEVPDCNDTLVVVQGDEGGDIEPFFDEEDVRDLNFQTLEDAIRQDCELASGTVWVTSDGKVGCEDTGTSGEEDDDVEFVSPGEPPHIEPTLIPVEVR